VRVNWSDDVEARVAIADLIRSLLPPGRARDGFGESIGAYARSDAYSFLIAFPEDGGEALSDACCVAIFSIYQLPMANRAVLGLDGLAVRATALEDAIAFLRVLVRIAARRGLHAVCMAEGGVAKRGLVRALAERGRLDAEPIGVGRPWMMRRESAEVWSPFADGPIPDRVFEAVPCLTIVTEDLTVDASGEPYPAAEPLYRGEGRLRCDGWECATLEEVAAHLRKVGFEPRSDAGFAGTVQEQILHQGYVPQGTVSLSSSFDVCAYYATCRGERPSGIVLTIDPDRLRARGPIWDAYATLVRHCDWFFAGEFETLTAVVETLGVERAGPFLARLHAGTRARVERTGGFKPLAGPVDWDAYLDGELGRLRDAGLERERLDGLNDALELYWMRALGQVGAEDVIHIGGRGEEPTVEARPLGKLAYELAFLEVEPRLRTDALAPPDPGWDLTAFGYIAKTCRDREFLSTGPVPADCIVAATLV
jgi:hypothetical protein